MKEKKFFNDAFEIDPDFGLAFVRRGAVLMRMHRIEESIANRRDLTNL